jgi:hypothetical protein
MCYYKYVFIYILDSLNFQLYTAEKYIFLLVMHKFI